MNWQPRRQAVPPAKYCRSYARVGLGTYGLFSTPFGLELVSQQFTHPESFIDIHFYHLCLFYTCVYSTRWDEGNATRDMDDYGRLAAPSNTFTAHMHARPGRIDKFAH